MTKASALKTLETLENAFLSLRGLIDDVFSERERLTQDQEENVRIRSQIIGGQKKVLADLKKVEDERKLFDKRKESLDLERAEIERLIGVSNQKKLDMEEQAHKLDEKMEVAKNLDAWTTKLEEKEQELQNGLARLRIEKADFEAIKERTRLQSKENEDFRLSLDRREADLKAGQARVNKILGNV